MATWQADFYRRPLQNERGEPLWELLMCDPESSWRYMALCPQPEVSADWVKEQLQNLQAAGVTLPKAIAVFRPQALALLKLACEPLEILVEPTRHVPVIKQWLQARSHDYLTAPNYTGQSYDPLALDRPPPTPVPESQMGEQWRFASLPAVDLVEAFSGRMIPILEMPPALLPLQLGLASTVLVPGVIIDGGRRSMHIARWLDAIAPVALNYQPGAPDGLILEAGLVDRWILATFDDPEVAIAARQYTARQQTSQGLHFLLVQPDNSGQTYSGFWLLRSDKSP